MLNRKLDHWARACAIEMGMGRVQEPFCMEILHGKRPGTPPRTPFCTSLRSRKRTCIFTRAILCENLLGKWPDANPGSPFRASVRNRNAHGHFTRANYVETYRESAGHGRYHLD